MKKVLSVLVHPLFITFIGFFALGLVIWFLGPGIKFGENNNAPLASVNARIIAAVILFMLWVMNGLWGMLRAAKKNQNFVSDIKDSAENNQLDPTAEQSSEEFQQLSDRFNQALSTLKRVRVNKKGAKQALYELPWYLIIGPPGSGKTTALINSGLDFPLESTHGQGAIKGVGGTRNCDWWFTNEAVLIDTAGRYTTQDSHKVVDSSAWDAFLNLLKKNRKRRPINGALVSISLQDILTQTEDERLQHAKTIRARIDELMEKLEVRFPVYLVFTKADLVTGFSEFFEDLAKNDRDQVWGVSLPDANGLSDSPDFVYLVQELNRLTERLNDRMVNRMHQERDSKRRAKIQGFPHQFDVAKTIAQDFCQKCFSVNRFKFQPYLRGVYFTSGTQDGTPIDRLMASVSANFGLSPDVARAEHQQGKSFFLNQLFGQVIFPESEIVGANVRHERLMRWLQRGAYGLMCVVFIAAIATWSATVMRHKSYLGEMSSLVETYDDATAKTARWNHDVRATLPGLNALAKASVVYDQKSHRWLRGVGLYDNRVDKAADQSYQTSLNESFAPSLMRLMEGVLNDGYEASDLYNTFRVYLMFEKTEHRENQAVINWFNQYWDENLLGEGTTRQELTAHLKAWLDQKPESLELNQSVVASTRQALLKEPVSKRVYSRIRSNPEYLQAVDFYAELGDNLRKVFQIDSQVKRKLLVPFLFTKAGYKALDLNKNSPVIEDIVNERWMFADDENTQKLDFIEDDLGEISKKVKQHYLAEYTQVWRDVYASLSLVEFKDIRHAEQVLTTMTDTVYSPVIGFLQLGAENTKLDNPLLEKASNLKLRPRGKLKRLDKKGEGSNAGKEKLLGKLSNPVDRQFKEVNALLKESKRGPAPINGLLEKVQTLRDFMSDIVLAPVPSKKAFDIAKARFTSGSSNAISDVRSFAQSQPAPVKAWLESLSQQSWKVVVAQGGGHISNEWRDLVYSPFQRSLKGRYPLKAGSGEEVAMIDFADFFKPDGVLDAFKAEYVAPFVSRSGSKRRAVDGYSMGLPQKAINKLRSASSIKKMLFQEKADAMSISMSLKPKSLGERDARFILELGDERLTYNHGPKFWKTLRWSSDLENPRIRVIFEDIRGQQHVRTFTGPWAFFRLLDSATITRSGQSNRYSVTFAVADNANSRLKHKITYEVKTQSVNNPLRRDLLGNFDLPSRL